MFQKQVLHSFVLAVSVVILAPAAHASEKLDRPYKSKKGIATELKISERLRSFFNFEFPFVLPRSSDLKAMFEIMTPVKSQGGRGTCSIFSMAALMESEMIRKFGLSKSTNFSEQWLSYLVVKNNGDTGSEAYINLDLMDQHGMASERSLPYNEESWEKVSVGSHREAKAACGHLKSTKLKMCLDAQKDTALIDLSETELKSEDVELFGAYKSGLMMHSKYLKAMGGESTLDSEVVVKKLLNDGIPVIAEMDFYYGAWNHREADDLGIGRSEDLFTQGIVGYPAEGSVDRAKSTVGKAAAGHSILLIGYDDELEVTTEQKMVGGGTKTFTYKGIYYFKNSWGTDHFGSESQLNGRTAGYGMITQAYVNELAALYKFPWK